MAPLSLKSPSVPLRQNKLVTWLLSLISRQTSYRSLRFRRDVTNPFSQWAMTRPSHISESLAMQGSVKILSSSCMVNLVLTWGGDSRNVPQTKQGLNSVSFFLVKLLLPGPPTHTHTPSNRVPRFPFAKPPKVAVIMKSTGHFGQLKGKSSDPFPLIMEADGVKDYFALGGDPPQEEQLP